MNENELQVLRELVEIGAVEVPSTDARGTLAEPVDPGPEGSYPGIENGSRMLEDESLVPPAPDLGDESLDPRTAFTEWKAAQKKRPAPTPRRRNEPLEGQTSLLFD